MIIIPVVFITPIDHQTPLILSPSNPMRHYSPFPSGDYSYSFARLSSVGGRGGGGAAMHPLTRLEALQLELLELLEEERLRERIAWRLAAERIEEQIRREIMMEMEMNRSIPTPRLRYQFDERLPLPPPSSSLPLQIKKRRLDERLPLIAEIEPASSRMFPRTRTGQKDWSCALCRVTATCEEDLKVHLRGKKHMAKAAEEFEGAKKKGKKPDDGVGIKNGGGRDKGKGKGGVREWKKRRGWKKVRIEVKGEQHWVMQRKNCLWCQACNVRCYCDGAMADHISGKKHTSMAGGGVKKSQTLRRKTL